MLSILSLMNTLIQPIVSAFAVIAWFGILLGKRRLSFDSVSCMLGTVLLIEMLRVLIVPPTFQVTFASTLTIGSLWCYSTRGQVTVNRWVILLNAIISSLLAAWVYNVELTILSWLTVSPLTALLCHLLASGLTVLLVAIPYWYQFEWLTASFFKTHPRQLVSYLIIGGAIRGLNDYLAYLFINTAYEGSLLWETASLLLVLFIILTPLLRHQYELLTCKLQQRDRMLLATQQYTNQLEKQYLAYRTFRHDYKNILASLAYGIQNGSMKDVQYAYESVIKTSQHALPQAQTLQLHLIADINLRSALLVKYQEAVRQKIHFVIDIQAVFQPKLVTSDVDFYRVFGILLDNAIESAAETSEKLVTVVFIGSEQLAIINSCLQQLRLTQSVAVGYSSKPGHAGLGLYFVEEFVTQRRDIELITITEKTRVRQELTFGVAS